jgi:hypothetical protein
LLNFSDSIRRTNHQELNYMLPEQSEIELFPVLNAFFYKLKQWIAAEIVDDDPWDQDTLLPSPEANPSKLSEDESTDYDGKLD